MKALDTAMFGCSACDKQVAISTVVLLEDYTYIFIAECECGAENHFSLVSILGSLKPKLVAEGSKLVN